MPVRCRSGHSFSVVILVFFLATNSSFGRTDDFTISQVQAIITQEATRLGLEPSMGLALAHVESNFSARALSSKGARGVMQVMPATAWGEFGIHADELWDARINIRVGLFFFKLLLDDYRGEVRFALSYYNGGSATGAWPNARVLPYTRAYIDKVMKYDNLYRIALSTRGNIQ